jgi:hypothetical protein
MLAAEMWRRWRVTKEEGEKVVGDLLCLRLLKRTRGTRGCKQGGWYESISSLLCPPTLIFLSKQNTMPYFV